ncbi:hypothetical protein IPF37_02845 [bacterium]|nr:MAG: hypothetical protein IPF37_02845 [bacterium]
MKKVVLLVVGLWCTSAQAQVPSEIGVAQALTHNAELVKVCCILREKNMLSEKVFQKLMGQDEKKMNSAASLLPEWLHNYGDIAAVWGFMSVFYIFWYIIDPEVFKAMCDDDILQNAVEERS